MIVTKRESMASLIQALHYDIVCNKVIIRACIMDSEMPYFLVLWNVITTSCVLTSIIILIKTSLEAQ